MQSIYFNHMMKTGGRSIRTSFKNHRSFSSRHDLKVYPYQPYIDPQRPLSNGKVHGVNEVFTITAIREPIERLLSHFRMLVQFALKEEPHRPNGGMDSPDDWETWLNLPHLAFLPAKALHEKITPETFDYFLNHYPDQWRIHQLHFYSPDGDPDEAYNNIIKNTQIILTEKIQEGLDSFAKKTNYYYTGGGIGVPEHGGWWASFPNPPPQLELKEVKPTEENKNEWQSTKEIKAFRLNYMNSRNSIGVILPSQLQHMKNILKDEYKFYNRVIKYYNKDLI